MKTAAQPGLYDPEESVPRLMGTRCSGCGTCFFPPLGIGCEICGAAQDQLEAAELAAAGELHSVATVHMHAGKDIQAPFTVGEVQLDDGPLVRCMMAELVEPAAIGARVAARWEVVSTDEDGNEVLEPRFALAAERAQ